MLTEDEIYGHATGMLNAAGGIYATSVIDFARAIESAVRAELIAASPLTDEQCDEFRRLPGTFNDMVRAIYEAGRASKAVEYADVPPEKWKALYRATSGIFTERTWTIDVERALGAIDKGTYNPKIGGEA